ncbi:response regulator [Deinococcus sp. Marseille-Q6407]|uniref:response regulator n=1 Tax=Deinococcus sp. Marseille-Q6407 TaxID=2969223 RepID=UPI0021C098F6|nr:response regulator [Deinococcus sp. Marseille-Q6407]
MEDEQADAELFQELLSDVAAHATVVHMANGQEALDYLQQLNDDLSDDQPQSRPNLIVLDLNMPVMNGHTFLEHAKKDERLSDIPVLVLSTSDHADDVQRAYQAHASGYLVKPTSFQEYTEMLRLMTSYWGEVMRLPRGH